MLRFLPPPPGGTFAPALALPQSSPPLSFDMEYVKETRWYGTVAGRVGGGSRLRDHVEPLLSALAAVRGGRPEDPKGGRRGAQSHWWVGESRRPSDPVLERCRGDGGCGGKGRAPAFGVVEGASRPSGGTQKAFLGVVLRDSFPSDARGTSTARFGQGGIRRHPVVRRGPPQAQQAREEGGWD